jgi:hypothetical protein
LGLVFLAPLGNVVSALRADPISLTDGALFSRDVTP